MATKKAPAPHEAFIGDATNTLQMDHQEGTAPLLLARILALEDKVHKKAEPAAEKPAKVKAKGK
jgi:hypothetical protein